MRLLMYSLAALALAYLAVAVYVARFQSRFIYFPHEPGRELDATPADVGLVFEDVGFSAADGTQLHGWFIPGADGPVILFFHGNAGNISHRLESIGQLNSLGASVFIIDYRGYGRSQGKTTETGTYDDALGAWNYLTGVRAIDPGQIVIYGRSLGGAVATWLATEVAAGGLILESTFTSVPDMARRVFPLLPTSLARIRYDNLARIGRVQSPILLMHSETDEIIPFSMSEKLRAAAKADITFLVMRGGHNDAHLATGQLYLDALRNFLTQKL